MKAAQQTRYGQTLNLREAESAVDPLQNVKAVDLLEFLCHSERYRPIKAPPVSRPRLHYPLGEAPQTAVIGRKVEETRNIKCFRHLRAEKLAEFQPDAIAAPVDALRAAAIGRKPLKNAVIAFTGILQGPLAREDADLFWNTYQVPVFEQFLGFDGELLAWECEMHQGLHVRETAAIFEPAAEERLRVSFLANPRIPVLRLETGLAGRLTTDACPCGNRSPRLLDLRRRSVRRESTPMPRVVQAAVG